MTDYKQSHYIEVPKGAIYMGQNMRFGLVLGWLVVVVVVDPFIFAFFCY